MITKEDFEVDDEAEGIDLVNVPPNNGFGDQDEVSDSNTSIHMIQNAPDTIEVHTT